MKIRYAFSKQKVDGKPLDSAIIYWTWLVNLGYKRKHKIPWKVYNALMCGHVELWLPGIHGAFTIEWRDFHSSTARDNGNGTSSVDYTYKQKASQYLGDCYTSTKQDGANGPRKGNANEVLAGRDWFFAEGEVPESHYDLLKEDLENSVINPKPYETGLLRRFFGIPVKDNVSEYICSEYCYEKTFLKVIGLPGNLNNPSPMRLALAMWLAGFKFYDLKTGKLIA